MDRQLAWRAGNGDCVLFPELHRGQRAERECHIARADCTQISGMAFEFNVAEFLVYRVQNDHQSIAIFSPLIP